MAWSGRDWEDIPSTTWENVELHIDRDGTFSIEFDYIGFNYHHYHMPAQEIEFEEFLDVYDEMQSLDIEFEVTYG